MAKTLELQFLNTAGKTVSLSIDSPKEPVVEADIMAVMDSIIAENAFTSTGGAFAAKKGARVIERNVEEVFEQE
ncbi:DUF2922 domain-containing protein [Metabacillus arenae]|uniref:DUF2922 domain-containing protein n=1 Tax=Metabacillus arenae TaxID=2771434 RepID=A0A926S3T3_9BACI|nr:DUF2922 domain-containing protein [Metabacillus arenae]MBD1383284.1 DUF2922 domain-containing protein [Metabacillus arenae]